MGGTSAFVSHLVKTGTRVAVNTSPEPFTNIAVSLGEDVVVLALTWFAVQHPYIAGSIALTLLLLGLVLLWLSWRLVRRGWRRFRAWRQGRPTGPGAPRPLT